MKECGVHCYEEAVAALRAPSCCGKETIIWNAPGTAAYAGFMYIKAMFGLALERVPEARVKFGFDAGDDAPAAILAMQSGFGAVHYSGPEPVLKKLRDIGGQFGCDVIGQNNHGSSYENHSES